MNFQMHDLSIHENEEGEIVLTQMGFEEPSHQIILAKEQIATVILWLELFQKDPKKND